MPRPSVDRVRARAWCRADLAGGTLDIWPLGLLHAEACTVNVALDLAVELTLQRRASGYRVSQDRETVGAATLDELVLEPETALLGLVARHFRLPPVDVMVASQSPRGGGLGGSSALTVAMIGAAEALIRAEPSTADERSAVARDLEAQLMRLPTGMQDHYPAILGGVLRIDHRPGGATVRPVEMDVEALADSLIIVYSGQSHFSAGKNWEIVRRQLDADGPTSDRLGDIAKVAAEMPSALESDDLAAVGELMNQEWSYRKALAPGISTGKIEELLAIAQRYGAWGAKACGAGGGGCLAILAPPDARAPLEIALTEGGAELLATKPQTSPMMVETA